MKLSIIIPAYNEEKTIGGILDKIIALELPVEKKIIVVDDGSTDKTGKLLMDKCLKSDVILITQKNQGKGAAIAAGIVLANDSNMIIIQDADFEYDPEDIKKVIQPIIEDKADVVFGVRDFTNKNFNYFGNRMLSKLTSFLLGRRVSDMETCYKCFVPNKLIGNIESKGFELEPELTMKLLKNKNTRYVEVPISYNGRTKAEGKKIKTSDGIKAVLHLFKWRFL